MFDATQQDVSCGGGVGWGGYDDVHLHLHTCLMLRNRMFHVGVGWGGVGMMTFICTCTHLLRQKKDAKTSQNTDVSNVHFLLQITYETHDH